MSDDQPTPEEQRAQQRADWRKALAAANKQARTQRAIRKPRPGKAGMHRKASDR